MTRHVAFLRAINVGGHTVKKDQLVAVFEGLGLAGVSTFLASGNVRFGSDDPTAELERRIAAALATTLGYGVETFVRTDDELAAVAGADPFGGAALESGESRHVAFLHLPPGQEALDAVLAYGNDGDVLAFVGRELHWLRRGPFSDSALSGPKLERALGVPTTVRNLNTVRRLASA